MNVDLLPPTLFRRLKRPLSLLVRKLGGGRLQASVHYRDYGMYGGVFDAPTARVQPRLPPGFEVLEQSQGLTEVHICALDYRDVDWLAPYRELGVFIPARFRPRGAPPVEGQFVLALPVTSEEARWTGVENFGYPKIVADIRISTDNGTQVCTASHAGQHVLTLRVGPRPTEPGAMRDRNLTVRDDGMVIASTFDSEGELAIDTAPGGVQLELGYHAIADQLRELGVRLESGRVIYAPHRHAVLGRAIEVAPLAAATATPILRVVPTIMRGEPRGVERGS